MEERTAFCSISTPSYLTQVLNCIRSIRAHHSDAKFAVLFFATDGEPWSMPVIPGIRFFSLEDCVPDDAIWEMRHRYTTAEICFAMKPFLIRALLREGFDQVHYLDGDCLAFNSLTPLIQELSKYDILLTPHSLSPIPDDGCTPQALTLLRSGIFNGGYIGVRSTDQGRAFVDWLGTMTRTYATNSPDLGMCGDQRWLDLVPVLFPGMGICRLETANVAYWNLHERRLTIDSGGGFNVNEQPLLFFHFSGFRLDQPFELSIHQNRHPATPGSPLQQLLQMYIKQLAGRSLPRMPPWWRRWLRYIRIPLAA